MEPNPLLLTEAYRDNVLALKAQFFEDHSLLPYLGAFFPTEAALRFDAASLNYGKSLLAPTEQRFDGLSEELAPILTACISMQPAPEAALLRIVSAYQALKGQFLPSVHLICAGTLLARLRPEREDFEEDARRACGVYRLFGQEHPFLTGFEDIPFCVLCALEPDTAAICDRIGRCTDLLQPLGRMRNALQSLVYSLSLDPEPDAACGRALALSALLEHSDLSLGRGMPLVGLSALCLCGASPEAAAVSVRDIFSRLGGQPGFRLLELSGKHRLLLACLLAALCCRSPKSTVADQGFLAALYCMIADNLTDSLEGLTIVRENNTTGLL